MKRKLAAAVLTFTLATTGAAYPRPSEAGPVLVAVIVTTILFWGCEAH